MNIYNILFASLFLSVFLYSCSVSKSDDSHSSQPTNNQLNFKKKYILKPFNTNINGAEIGRVMMMQMIDTNLVIGDIAKEYLYKVYSSNGQLLFNLCKVGEGPNEFKFPTFLQSYIKNSQTKVKTYNSSQNKINEFDWSETLKTRKINLNLDAEISTNINCQRVLYLPSTSKIIAVGLFKNRYNIFDSKGKLIQKIGNYPHEDSFPQTTFETFAMAYQGNFVIDNTGKHIAFSTTSSSNIDFMELNKTNQLAIIKQYHISKPEFIASSNPNEISATLKVTNKMGYLSLQADQQYIYALYSGKTSKKGIFDAFKSNKIYIFDWNGNTVAELELEVEISQFTIDPHTRKIYAFVDLQTPKIIYFKLPKNL